jgi:hypothetical protein
MAQRVAVCGGMALVLLAQPQRLAAREGFPLVVRVNGPDGKGMPGVLVRAEKASTVTGAEGAGRFEALPPGRTGIEILQPGFDELRTNAVVGAAAPELTLWLAPELLIEVELAVVDSETSNAVAGATVSLSPVRIASSLRGPVQGCTDFDGKVSVGRLPVGCTRRGSPPRG